jgi:HAD superfamily hydrolase (TIGR01662 family)
VKQPPRAVFFDVDFTLIYPGPTFQPEGYREFCARYSMDVDSARFTAAVADASRMLVDDEQGDLAYDPQLFVDFTRRIIQGMGGNGPRLDECAWKIYEEWAACQHFELYDDVSDVLRRLHGAGIRIGLISNTHRCLETFQRHFELTGLITAAISSSAHGKMKPHPAIFETALREVGVNDPAEAAMVGDSVVHDMEGARRIGMQGVLVVRAGDPRDVPADVTVIRSLRELPGILHVHGIPHPAAEDA